MRTQSVLHLLEGAEITPKKRREAEAQIWELRKKINYDTREYCVEDLLDMFKDKTLRISGRKKSSWSWEKSSRFIENELLLRMPTISMAFRRKKDHFLIIDGKKKALTLKKFVADGFPLTSLKWIPSMNHFYFSDFSAGMKREFQECPLRVIVIDDDTPEGIFEESANSDMHQPDSIGTR